MRTVLLRRISVSSSFAFVALVFLWLALLPGSAAQSIEPSPGTSQPHLAQTPSLPVTDTRWLNLITSIAPRHRSSASMPTLNLHLTDQIVAGRVASGETVYVSVTRGSELMSYQQATPLPMDGSFLYVVSSVCSYWPCNGLQPGDSVWVSQSGSTISLTVPTLTALADSHVDAVYGSAPISQPVTTYLYPFATPDTFYTRTANADAGGQYQVVYSPTLDVQPRDTGYVMYAAAPDRRVYVRFATPFLRAQVNGTAISGIAAPNSMVSLTVMLTDGAPLAWWPGYSNVNGVFSSEPYGTRLLPGAHITAAAANQVFSMTVMSITAQANLNAGEVFGEALPDQSIEVGRFNGPVTDNSLDWSASPIEQTIVTTTVAGQYTATLPITRPNYGLATITTPDGNQTYALWVVPYLTARMGRVQYFQSQVGGQVAEPYAPITLTIQGPSGYNKDVRSLTAGRHGAFDDYAYPLLLDSGDVLTVTTPHGVEAALTLPQLTGQIDLVSDTVSGQAPPNARLTLQFYYVNVYPASAAPGGGGYPPPNTQFVVTATAQGDYFLDLHGLLDFYSDSIGEVFMTTADGHTVSRVFGVSQADDLCSLGLQTVYVGRPQIDLRSTGKCPQYVNLTVRLRSSTGQLKATYDTLLYPYQFLYQIYLYAGSQPVLIASGDIIELASHSSPTPYPSSTATPYPLWTPTPYPAPTQVPAPTSTPWLPSKSDQFITVTVPTLTVQLDASADVVSGLAPANIIVSLQIYRERNLQRAFTTTVTAQGTYSVDLTGGVSLMAGDTASVSYAAIGMPTFQTMTVLPVLRARPYDGAVSGWLPPLTAYTAALETARPVSVTRQGVTGIDGSLGVWLASIEPGDTIVVTTAQQVRRLTMPQLSAQVWPDTATITGQAPSNSRLRFEVWPQTQWVTATASGTYSVSFPALAPATSLYGLLTYFDSDGDQIQLDFATAHWGVTLDQSCINGITNMSNAPITLTLRNGQGALKSAFSVTTFSTSYSGCFTQTVQAYDRLTLKTPSTVITFAVPLLTAQHDYKLKVLTGIAPANQAVLAEFFYPYPYGQAFQRRTWAYSNGQYGLDTSDLSLSLQQTGRVIFSDAAGNTTARSFTITGYRSFLPIMRK